MLLRSECCNLTRRPERARLHGEVLETRRLEEELSIGQRIQRTFLPERDPRIPGFDIAGVQGVGSLTGGPA